MPVAHMCIGRGVDRPPPSSAEVKERVRIWAFMVSLSWSLHLSFFYGLPTMHLSIILATDKLNEQILVL